MSLSESDMGRVMLVAAADAYRRNTTAHEDRPHPLVAAVAAALQALGVELRAQNLARSRVAMNAVDHAALLESVRIQHLMTSLAYIVGLPAVWGPVLGGRRLPGVSAAEPVMDGPAVEEPRDVNDHDDVNDDDR